MDRLKDKMGKNGDTMSFAEIAEVMGISEGEVKRIYEGAIRKLKHPKNARILWDYLHIGDTSESVEGDVEKH